MQKHTGIILKNYSPFKQKVSIFDSILGRIEALLEQNSLRYPCVVSYGALFSYYIQSTTTTLYRLTQVEIVNIPFDMAKHDIYFLHHILELCYYFLPLHTPQPILFEMLDILFKKSYCNKPMILLRFFGELGLYPEDVPFEKTYFHYLLYSPLEIIMKEKLDDMQLKMLQSWLMRCIAMHPYKNKFKTHYLAMTSYEKM